MTEWPQDRWVNTILFHHRLFKDKIVIEDDNFAEGLSPILIQSGIAAEDIINRLSLEQNYPGDRSLLYT